jgi:peptide/nickel transport system substrate-binding protein
MSLRFLLVIAVATFATVLAACAADTEIVEVIKEVVVEKEVVKEVQVPGETVTITQEVIKEVQVPGQTITVTKEVIKEVQVAGETVVVEKEVVKIVEVIKEVVVVEEKIVQGVTAAPESIKGVQTVAREKTKPSYGGTLRLADGSDPGAKWDMCEFKAQWYLNYPVENWLLGDYTKGPSGTGETTFQPRLGIGTDKLAVGAMADKWDLPDQLTYRFHLRPGIKWQNNDITNGRLVNIEELVAEANRIKDCRWPRHDFVDSITADDTDDDGIADSMVYHTNKPISFWGYEFAWGPYFIFAPPETIALGTDNPLNQSGTGPWMVESYTAASLVEFVRNPDWYMTWTEKGREYALPFIDKIQSIIIPLEATRLAALRTGKLDSLGGVRTTDRPAIQKSNPDLGRVLAITNSYGYFMPMNKPPFDDLRVRTAMNMAIDRDVYTQALFGGDGVTLSFPLQPEWPLHYEPLEEQPQSVQDYFTYNPAGAEALLDEAGLTRDADGTRLEIDLLISNTSEMETEAAQISQGFWDDIGVKVSLDLVDQPVHQSRLFEKQFDFFANSITGRPNALNDFREGHQWNRSNLNDPDWHELWEDVLVATDSGDQADAIKKATSAFLVLAPSVQVPSGFEGVYWQPWLQNHSGENVLCFLCFSVKWAYVWIDRDFRAEETGFKD